MARLQALWEGRIVEALAGKAWSRRVHDTIVFLFLVVRGFVDNRGPTRAAALSYTTLLALVPLLAVMLSVSKNFLKETSADVVPRLLDQAVAKVAPQLELVASGEKTAATSNQVALSSSARRETVQQIQSFIDTIDAGALGTVGTLLLVVVAVQLLTTVENTFNDIWGVQRGRTIWRKVVYYWSTITLGPLLLVGAMYLTGRLEYLRQVGSLWSGTWVERLFLNLIPFAVLWVGFTLMYALMPNTYVRPRAAFIGGVVGGTLWQLNSLLSTLYVSRVMTYSKIYGGLGVLPIFLVGVYFSWLIVLFGAQVSFAAQNVRAYLQQRLTEQFDQAARELTACRMVLAACRSFLKGEPPPRVEQIAESLKVPSQLLNQLVHRLTEAGVLSEVADGNGGLLPARAPEAITLADVLHVMRYRDGGAGAALVSGSEEVLDKLLRDLKGAERNAPANLNLRDLATR